MSRGTSVSSGSSSEDTNRTDFGGLKDLAPGRHRIGEIDVTFVELVVQDDDPVERRWPQAAAFADRRSNIFDIEAVITAGGLGLHLIAS